MGQTAAKLPRVVNLSVERLRKTHDIKSVSSWEEEGMDADIIRTEDGKANRRGKT